VLELSLLLVLVLVLELSLLLVLVLVVELSLLLVLVLVLELSLLLVLVLVLELSLLLVLVLVLELSLLLELVLVLELSLLLVLVLVLELSLLLVLVRVLRQTSKPVKRREAPSPKASTTRTTVWPARFGCAATSTSRKSVAVPSGAFKSPALIVCATSPPRGRACTATKSEESAPTSGSRITCTVTV